MKSPFWVFAAVFLPALLLPPCAAAEPVAIVNGRIVTMGEAGIIENGTILVEDGRILAVGAELDIPADARIVDARGGTITPGLIAAGSSLGVLEISSTPSTIDDRVDSSRLGAAFDVSHGINPDSTAIPVARLGGVTRAVISPIYGRSGGRDTMLFAGQAALIALDGELASEPDPRIAMMLGLDEAAAQRAGGARGAVHTLLRAQIAAVRDDGRASDVGLSLEDFEALGPVVAGDRPLVVSVSSAADILKVVALAEDFDLDIVLNGAEEAWRVADAIAAAGIPVILNPTANLPTRFETMSASFRNAAVLHHAGVRIAIVGNDSAHRVREMRYNAGMAVARGLPYQAALEALTINPALIFGLQDRLGSVEAGKIADIVVWDGDPLEPASQPQFIFIDGREQPLTSRALALRDRYLPAICQDIEDSPC